jgi:hypothetical protein
MAKRLGDVLPDDFANAPAVAVGCDIYYQAFWDLDSERQVTGMSIGRIPWSKVILYAEVYGFDKRQTKLLVRVIKALDVTYIGHFSKKMEKQ